MSKTFNIIRGESAIINACFEFASNIYRIETPILESTIELLTYSPIDNIYETPVKQLYIDMIKAVIASNQATEKLRNR